MLKRSVILGSLVAGAFLLPVVANAAVQGVCSLCHTMHASQDGVSGTPQNTLLKAGGCNGCHLVAGVENLSTGHAADAIGAPQVDNNGSSGYILNGGYFNVAADDNTHHNVRDITGETADSHFAANATAPGGGTIAVNDGTGLPVLTCASCHGANGGHHGTSATAYRLLNPTVTMQVPDSGTKDWGAVSAATAQVGHRAAGTRVYNAQSVNEFCANCHPNFHNSATNNNESATPGTWLRHPTGNHVATSAGPSILNAVDATTDTDKVVVGGDAGSSDIVMCLSCHVPHGGPYADLLSFQYDASNNVAGDTSRSEGCETCHSYGPVGAGTGM